MLWFVWIVLFRFNRTLFLRASMSAVNLINSIPGRPHCRMNLAAGTFSLP